MKIEGFVRVASAAPLVKPGDVETNTQNILETMAQAAEKGVKLLVLPELCVTGATCGDLFRDEVLTDAAKDALCRIAEASKGSGCVTLVGLPLMLGQAVYACTAVVFDGEVRGLVPAIDVRGRERVFASGRGVDTFVTLLGKSVPMRAYLIFARGDMKFACVTGEELYSPTSLAGDLAAGGAVILCNPASASEFAGQADKRRRGVTALSELLACTVLRSEAGACESNTDGVYAGHQLISECGDLLCEVLPFAGGMAITETDIGRMCAIRKREQMFDNTTEDESAIELEDGFFCACEPTRKLGAEPFLPKDGQAVDKYCQDILSMQARALAQRLTHTHSQRAVLGISGGLDSTLALLVSVRAMDILGMERKNVLAVTMPCFGTSSRTKSNAQKITEMLGAELMQVNIGEAVKLHFRDIGQPEGKLDVTFENSQARERTQVLMDLANRVNGMVIGTGDLSELTLGFATYNGDHMSMYGVNGTVPKTLIRHIVRSEAAHCGNDELAACLLDVVATPVSPELLPADSAGNIAQVTEDIVGPYELHDFFIYYALYMRYRPRKVYALAVNALPAYAPEVIQKWLRNFYRRFFMQQFKRSCLPDGPKVTCVSLSPRGGLVMPSDAVGSLWLREVDLL